MNLKPLRRGVSCAALVFVLASCQQENTTSDSAAEPWSGPAVATVDGAEIPQPLLMALLRIRGQVDAGPEQQAQAVTDLVDLHLLEKYARESGLLDRETIRATLEVRRLSWVADQVVAQATQQNPITADDVQAEYERQLARSGDKEFRLRHVLVPTREMADQLIGRLGGGEAFGVLEDEIAETYGISASGALGWVTLAQVPEAFGGALQTLEPGKHSGPVNSEYGWHILLLEDIRDYPAPELDQVRDAIEASLARKRTEDFLQSLRDSASISSSMSDS